MEREVVVDFAAGWNKHIVNTSSAICKPVRSSDKGLCMHQRAGVWNQSPPFYPTFLVTGSAGRDIDWTPHAWCEYPLIAFARLTQLSSFGSVWSPARWSQKTSVRILLAMLHFMFFVMSYCFTGGYTSFLNMPILEEAPDTKEELLNVLWAGRLRACIWGNSQFGHLRRAHEKARGCAIRQRSTFWSGMSKLSRVQVEISKDFLLGFRPLCYVLPRASPYENSVQNAYSRPPLWSTSDGVTRRCLQILV
ncbi:hypothetical protein HPB51_013762 [Rhipicephalus microplus]|uniref:Ionotropic glutamate receptor C-terminal domain-containing protein n=1 Tax=Rhipicephalus microplus TaxID=6941 RepID=A0A9J6F2S3_RHIMP|nr:hypothetical protein HPB51_013762 [Rhipicephalus microplus]